jgi:hypothetical protein
LPPRARKCSYSLNSPAISATHSVWNSMWHCPDNASQGNRKHHNQHGIVASAEALRPEQVSLIGNRGAYRRPNESLKKTHTSCDGTGRHDCDGAAGVIANTTTSAATTTSTATATSGATATTAAS